MSTLSSAKSHHREHALDLHQAFLAADRVMRIERATLADRMRHISEEFKNKAYNILDHKTQVIDTYLPKCSVKTLSNKIRKWKSAGRTPESLLPNYAKPKGKCPDALTKEIQRRATAVTGGRDKHGTSPSSAVYKSLCADWQQGKPIPGFGTWQDWWINNHDTPLPKKAPEFPLCSKTIDRKIPDKLLRGMGNIGAAAAKKHAPFITLNYSNLRKSELFTLDDVRLDILCIDERTGRAVEVICYILMECASRSIVSFICKPQNSILATDVDELIAAGLQTPGYGLGRDYQTQIIFERGTVACSAAAQAILEGATDHGIKVRRTGMTGGIRWTGSATDKGIGNSLGKAVIESFNRRLHYALLHLPGQRGNTRDNQPQNLGLASTKQSSGTGKGKKTQKQKKQSKASQSLVREAEKLARFQILNNATAKSPQQRLKLHLPMLWFGQLKHAVHAAILAHNNEPGHAYQGHGHFYEAEVRPGVWEETNIAL